VPSGLKHFGHCGRFSDLGGADLVLGGFKIDVEEKTSVVEKCRDGGCDANRAIGHLQEFGHDEGRSAHHRRHQLPAGRPDGFDCRRAVGREARAHHRRNRDDADREHIAHRAAGNHAEQRRPDHRDFGCATTKTAHGCHRNIGKEIGATGPRQDLSKDRKGNNDDDCNMEDRTDRAVDVEAKIDGHTLGRHVTRLKIP